MTQDPVSQLVDGYWSGAAEKLDGLDAAGHERLNIANDAVDAIWDHQVFDHVETFGGPEIGYARTVSAGVLARLLEVEYVALASAGSSEVPGSGIPDLDALSARNNPYEFRVANIGEVFALLGLHETLKSRMPERYQEGRQRILGALPKYQAARAYLFSYDRFEDVPLKGADRTEPPDAERLLLYREGAPAFGVVVRAFAKHRR